MVSSGAGVGSDLAANLLLRGRLRYARIVVATMADSIRNIERIEEGDDAPKTPRSVVVVLLVLGGACVFFAALALGGRSAGPVEKKSDPLGDLLAQRARPFATTPGAPSGADLTPREVTFPRLLSDDDHPPTALAAVRAGAPPAGMALAAGGLAPSPTSAPSPLPSPSLPGAASPPASPQPPPATDRLSVVPLPAQAVLEATPLVTRPRDPLTKAANEVARIDLSASPSGDSAPAGHDGGFQLQVSSFHTEAEAQAFAEQLRARGHKAYVVEATVPGRGTWYRVRIGPFGSQRAAAESRATFEDREHVVPFIVIPDSVGRGR
jgi:DedD protein